MHQEQIFMLKAIKLATRATYSCMPNPKVGCVITDADNKIIAEGWHRVSGGDHAEIEALKLVKNTAENSILYVTLEPCYHYGKTPPCVDAIIAAKVAKVIIAMPDPNPAVAGKSIQKLQQAGIQVIVGVCQQEAEQLNKGFIKRMLCNKPLVRVKMALSLDGRTAMANGDSKWITCKQSRVAVQELRAISCAVITGVGTVIKDDPSLNVRYDQLVNLEKEYHLTNRQPIRVIVDSKLKTPVTAKILNLLGPVIIATTRYDKQYIQSLRSQHVTITKLPSQNDRVCLDSLLTKLATQYQCNEVLIEAGNKLAGSFIVENLVDELIIMLAPKLMGSLALPAFDFPILSMEATINWYYHSVTKVGSCLKLVLKKQEK